MSASTTTKIFIGSIPSTVSQDHLRAEVRQYGRVTDIYYLPDQAQQDRGWACVTYSSRDEAIKAINAMDAKLVFPGGERPVEARFANQKASGSSNPGFQGGKGGGLPRPPSCWQQFMSPEGHPYYYNTLTMQTQWERPAELDMNTGGGVNPQMGMNGMGRGGAGAANRASSGVPGANLFIFHLPSDWNDIDLIQHFQHFGSILSGRIQRDREGRNRGFGFISFDSLASAANAVNGMNGFCVSGKFLKVQLKKGEEHFNPHCGEASMSQNPHPHMGMGGGGAVGGPFLGIHAHNNPSLRYAPY